MKCLNIVTCMWSNSLNTLTFIYSLINFRTSLLISLIPLANLNFLNSKSANQKAHYKTGLIDSNIQSINPELDTCN